jgi:hypothetical protein
MTLTDTIGVRVKLLMLIKTPHNKNLWLSEKQENYVRYKILKYMPHYNSKKIMLSSSNGIFQGVNFCSHLDISDIVINTKGEAVFCCDTIKEGAVIGSIIHEPLQEICKRKIDIAHKLKKFRVKQLLNGKITKDFNNCNLCNIILKSRIR